MALYQVKGKLDLSCFSSSPNQWKISESCPGSKPEGERKKERQKKTKPFLVSATGPREANDDPKYHIYGLGVQGAETPHP